ncbi:nuclear transport factor 2 family protein, partial [Photobacterium sp. OFAV2-7]|uniref:nuclear transport factor 2 family protein n=1 Tax=Photobacterium sp. OFAV2-7 TaxID=2917748 RepID=UPI001EF729EA
MTDNPAGFASFSEMLKRALGAKVDQSAQSFIEMVTQDCVMEFPYAPEGGVKKVEGSAALASYLTRVSKLVNIDQISEPTVHQTLNQDVVILEFDCNGQGLATGRPYNQRYISVITLNQGQIQHYLDYWNPLIAMDAIGDLSALAMK